MRFELVVLNVKSIFLGELFFIFRNWLFFGEVVFLGLEGFTFEVLEYRK